MDIEVFILIGGQSSRFGSDKAFFEFAGEALAARLARIARVAHPGSVVQFIAASEEQFGIELQDLDGELVVDGRPGFGAWSGLQAALSNSHAEWTLVLACDLPFVTPELLQQLGRERASDLDAVVPRQFEGRLQPLCGIYRTESVWVEVERFIDAGTRLPPLAGLLERLRTKVIDVDAGELRNVNTPDDLI